MEERIIKDINNLLTQLFQKMKEAGYEWDVEKKELKKVKKAPQKFMVGDTIKYNGTEYKITEITPNGYKVYALTYDEDAASLISFSAPAILVEQKPAWSEEDEEIHRKCICAMRASACGFPEEEKFVEQVDNWLKSFKDRVQPQQQEWSEEDEEILEEVQINFEINKGKMTPALQECYDRFFDKIKTLNPHLKKEWSEEDKEFINDLIGVFDGQQYQAHSDEEIVKWLKSIRLPYNKEWDENVKFEND